MKKIRKMSLLLLSIIFLFSCDSSDNNDNNNNSEFKVEIDGTLYEASNLEAGMGNDNKYFELSSINNNSDSVQFRFGDLDNPSAQQISSNLTFDSNSGDSIIIFYQEGATDFIAGGSVFNGLVNITDVNYDDNIISGTFSGMLFNPNYSPDVINDEEEFIVLTNGVFTNINFSTN